MVKHIDSLTLPSPIQDMHRDTDYIAKGIRQGCSVSVLLI